MKPKLKKKSIVCFLLIFAFCASSLFATKKLEEKGSMSFIGKWVFHSVMKMESNGEFKFLNAEELLKYIPDDIDQNDEKAMQDMQNSKKFIIDSVIEISTDGNLYFLIPIPKDVTKEVLDEAVASGDIILHNGMMMLDKPATWQNRNGELWVQTGMQNSFDGAGQKPQWEKCEIVDGILTILMVRYQRS